jgi:O-antigen ligase
MLFFILEYARPPGIVQLHLQMLIVLIMPLLWLSSPTKPWSRILTAQLLLLLWFAKSIPIAHNNYSAYFETRVLFGNISIAIGIAWLTSQRERFRQAIWVWLAIMCYVAVFSLTHGGTGPGGFLGDENDLALACGTAFSLAFYGFEWMQGWRRWISGAIAVLIVTAIIVSFSRGGFVALAASGLYCLIASRHKLRNLLVLAVAVQAFLSFAPQKYLGELQTIQDTRKGTANTRRFLWETAFNMWKDSPILGVGAGNFNYLAGRYQPTDFEGRDYQERNWSGTTVHSLYFQLLSEQGAVGLALFAYIAMLHFRSNRRLRREVRKTPGVPPDLLRDTELYGGALSGGMVAYLVAGIFLSVASYPYLFYFSAFAVGLNTAIRSELAAINPAEASGPDPAPTPAGV